MMKNFDLEKFKEFVNTYDKQMGHEDYEEETIINDFLYGIGLCLDEDEFSGADGFKRFKDKLRTHLGAVPAHLLPRKCWCGNPVDESNIDCASFKLCKDHASDS